MDFLSKLFRKKANESGPTTKQRDVSISSGNAGSTRLVDAARAGQFDTVLKLLQEGCNVNVRDEFGSTALIYAVAAHKEEVVKALLDHGADINLADDDGGTAFFYSIFWGCPVSTVKLLIEHGADVNFRDRKGNTALMIAAIAPSEEKHKREIIELLRNAEKRGTLMIDKKIALVKGSTYPENVYYFFLCTDVTDIPVKDLNYFFDLAVASHFFFKAFRDFDPISREAEKKLKETLVELNARMEIEHVPDLREPANLMLRDRPKWEGLDLLWEVYNDSVRK